MKKMKLTRSLLAACSIVALTAMTACLHDGDSDPPATGGDTMEPEPTAYEKALDAIQMAETAEDAQAAYDAVDLTMVTGDEAAKLQAALATRLNALAKDDRVKAQKMALMDAAGAIDTSDLSTQDLVDAARTAIAGLRQALADADDVSDADKAMYQSQLDAAVAKVDMAQGGLDTDTRRSNQKTALMNASEALQTALAALVGDTPTKEEIDDAKSALAKLNTAVEGAADLTEDEKAPYQREASNAAAPIKMAQTARDKADGDDKKKADAMMMATAMKLHMGIGAPMGDGTGNDDRHAAYATAEADAGKLAVTIGTGDAAGTAVNLSEDKKTMVADNHGWMGKKYMASGTGVDGMYEAVVYSNVGDPTPGKMFGSAAADDDYEYTLVGGSLSESDTEGTASRVASSSFDQPAGTKTFKLPENNKAVLISGSYHGVAGTYSCVPGSGNTCAARVAVSGFDLGGVTAADPPVFGAGNAVWTFKPSNPKARVMSVDDMNYASYGWWIHKSADGKTYTASAFVDDMGSVPAAAGLDTLKGTATYMGGAAGKYALYSSTGGTNDAGHFTAKAMLEADFNDNMISGTIDNFMGADGKARDWSVELKESGFNATGMIAASDGESGVDDPLKMTVWTIGGTAADAAGQWSGALKDNGDDGVPKVATGTFYSMYSTSGKMVGAFGANKQ